MLRPIFTIPTLSLAALFLCQPTMAQSYKFKTINIPGANETTLLDNAGGTIVGWNLDPSGTPTCTLVQGKTYTAISDPNGVQTYCYSTSSAGTVVGYYNTADNGVVGFTYNNGSFADFSLAGISGALPLAISTNGIIAGYYYQDNEPWGFVLKKTKVTTFQIPGASYVFPIGVNSHGEMTVQEIDTGGNEHCMVGNGASFTELSVPEATLTYCYGINNSGQIVGNYFDTTGAASGFAYDPATSGFYTINYPGAADTYIRGITGSKTLVGYYRATSGGHGRD
jgi:hypothetical protein